METWITINGHPNYQVSDMGRVRNQRTGHTLTPGQCSVSSYHKVVNLNGKSRSLSRLVGLHFLPMVGTDGRVLHIDETLPPDQVNSVYNLRVGTQSENIKDAYDKGRKHYPAQRGEASPCSILTEENVREIRDIWATPHHPTRKQLAERYGISPDTIKQVVLRRTWQHIQ